MCDKKFLPNPLRKLLVPTPSYGRKTETHFKVEHETDNFETKTESLILFFKTNTENGVICDISIETGMSFTKTA